MKATGIVRRIDDLGRVVIPKEIRRTMRIREGDPLEIYTNREGEVIFKKYSPIGEINSFASQYAETLYRTCNLEILICDRDAVIALAGVSKKDYIHKSITDEFYDACFQSEGLYCHKDKKIYACDDVKGNECDEFNLSTFNLLLLIFFVEQFILCCCFDILNNG